jgi:SpoVK/Ycf46/Vps4 family AAA+-type ATPase
MSDLIAASWTGEGGGLDALAQPITSSITDDVLVATPELRSDLESLLMRCRTRDELVEGLGASAAARYHPGVRALFVGPSGTGKTLAAGWIATKLGLPLYRVDLASVTSKYIGETEKNLAQLLARAEQAEVVLLFDEADSLFGKRTDVKEANDRFANAQTNYLLQRIESFDGITVLTSNSKSRFDSAFMRRLDLIVDFPSPGHEERRNLWLSHLGTDHRLSPREINQLSVAADLCGGHIRNVVLAAAVIARNAQRPFEFADVVAGLQREYRKLGQQMPPELRVES